ncbi:uncharacterized protein ColSpa_09638 [Colletotrichum spaethianum]|uniref:Uncharacterized protein n=1 Tax=Colletotrichum spaethianum TaxID=700344 RepID=A0AA37UQU2_9PEZI|nr:uncharacterized protein ColSpa_09638 [Colletotrichum spaethianum]GKT49457.1 hypothetical protein ColSpa_09638 [Colletotrichum spaethianum]
MDGHGFFCQAAVYDTIRAATDTVRARAPGTIQQERAYSPHRPAEQAFFCTGAEALRGRHATGHQ